jgi:hypothetical protein
MTKTLYAQPLRLTEAQYRRMENEMIGVCRKCRHQQGPLEPDARAIGASAAACRRWMGLRPCSNAGTWRSYETDLLCVRGPRPRR